jgi:hypothetical protein
MQCIEIFSQLWLIMESAIQGHNPGVSICNVGSRYVSVFPNRRGLDTVIVEITYLEPRLVARPRDCLALIATNLVGLSDQIINPKPRAAILGADVINEIHKRPAQIAMNKSERSSPPRIRGTGSPDHACEGSPPIDSSTGNASPALTGDPGNPLEVSASSTYLEDEVGWGSGALLLQE